MKKIIPFAFLSFLSISAMAEGLGSDSRVSQLREKITSALSIQKNTTSTIIDVVTNHIDTTDDWALAYRTGSDIYGDDYKNQKIKFFSVIIAKNGRTIIDSLSYNPETKQLILSEVENIVMSISSGVEDSEELSQNEEYAKLSESKNYAVFSKKGYLEDVAFSVNNSTQAIIKSYSNMFKETIK
ncbi:hypothetical protein [Motiliproteus sediminis]|uniref:hypothetical protein n=1 Tax=Motiliproteus sediminis TaxID=1468178 RepID=UPI001AF01460|nr:hypothetical protein [Motiliproteus sediminis]